MADLKILPSKIEEAKPTTVSFRQNWADAWVAVPGMYATSATWAVAPAMPSATIEWHYGQVKRFDQKNVAAALKTTATQKRRWFVKIDFTTRVWYGVVEEVEDQQHGANFLGEISGRVFLHCYGLEKLLTDHVVDKSFIDEPAGHQVNRAFDFNHLAGRRGEYPNRSAAVGPNFVHVFASQGDVTGQLWTTRQIVDYLLKYHTPVNHLGQVKVPFGVSGTAQGIPEWDKPQLQAEGQTTHSLLSQLIDRRRLLVWWLSVSEVQGGLDQVELVTRTLVSADVVINLGANHVIPANATPVNVILDDDTMTNISIADSGLQVVDQVVSRGARKRSVGTFSVQDQTLEEAWDSGHKTIYDTGASGGTGYGSVGTKEKQRRNAEVRANPLLADVYARFRIPPTWEQKVRDGVGVAAARSMFLDPFGALDRQAWSELFIEPTLPLLVGVDYSAGKILAGTVDETTGGDRQEMRPLVAFKRPDKAAGVATDRWVKAEAVGAAAEAERSGPDRSKQNERFSLYVEVPPQSHSLVVRVIGAPQHVIANTAFTRLAADEFVGYFDYDDGMLVTISLESQSYVEAYEPQVAPAQDVVRTKVIYAGDQYTQTYVVPDTVVDIDEDGALVRTTGGFIPPEGVADNVAHLRAIAKIAAAWYTRQHQIARIVTARPVTSAQIDIGYLVETIGGTFDGAAAHRQVIDSIVTEIRLDVPLSDATAVETPTLSIHTWAGELDAPEAQAPEQPKPMRPFPDRAAGRDPFVVDPHTGRGIINPELFR